MTLRLNLWVDGLEGPYELNLEDEDEEMIFFRSSAEPPNGTLRLQF